MRHACGRLRGPDRRHRDHQRRDDTDIRGVAVVTGGSAGIGAAIARSLAGRGWRCVLLARHEEPLRRLADEIGGDYEVCDVADLATVERAAAAVTARHPHVSLLVNNAGIPGRGGFLQLPNERIERVMQVNYLGSVWCARAFLPALEASRPSRVVNVVSVAGLVAWGPSGPYTASKHAQLAFSRSLAGELAPRGIRVQTVLPGFVETEGFPQRSTLAHPLLRRTVIQPEDVAAHVMRVLETGQRESFVPAWYRVAALAQGLLPGVLANLMARPAIASARRPEVSEGARPDESG